MTSGEPRPWALGLVALLLGAFAVGAFLLLRPGGSTDTSEAGTAGPLVGRLRTAHEFFDARDHQRALTEYLVILRESPRNPEALSHAGWIAYQSGDLEMGERLVRQSLSQQPDGPEALWFLANIRLYGRHDPGSAVRPLRTLLARSDLSADFRGEVEQLMTEASR